MSSDQITISNFSDSGGCAGKASRPLLTEILGESDIIKSTTSGEKDYLLMEDCSVMSTESDYYRLESLDFGGAIVDDPVLFGKISALNAISDVYAMGGKPQSALAIMGWNDNLPSSIAREILFGANQVADKLGFVISGGHTITNNNLFFGLSVVGHVKRNRVKRILSEVKNCKIYITKPLGTGIFTSALRGEMLSELDYNQLCAVLLADNSVGSDIGKLAYVSAMTDVTGFGFLGHLLNVLWASDLCAEVSIESLPMISGLELLLNKGVTSPASYRNIDAEAVGGNNLTDSQLSLLFDPQTNGGLLVLVDENFGCEFEKFCIDLNQSVWCVGNTSEYNKKRVYIE